MTIEKLNLDSKNLIESNIDKIAALFPNTITESRDSSGKLRKVIDFDKLKQELSNIIAEESKERYEFTWPGKRAAMAEANSPINKTLRPVVEESKNWDVTENLYIEGDNLEVLKLLQESYLGQVKMIYIDPPYNTGNDFVYNDDFRENLDDYNEDSSDYDEEGGKLVKNIESNGRFHSDWCSMIYPRLRLARNLISDDGLIFISIDDNEQENLKKICDEIFGEGNFLAQCVRKRRDSQANLSKNISPIHEYVFIYSKKNGDLLNKVPSKIDDGKYANLDNDPRGPYVTMPCTNKGGAKYTIETPTGKIISEEWRFKEETYYSLLSDNRLVFPRGGEGKPRYKLFLKDKIEEGQLANTWLDDLESNQVATRELKNLFEDKVLFDTPKPVGLIKFILKLATSEDSLILDFFSGSSSTAHAVMDLNAEDGGNRKYIMVNLPEATDENSEAFKAGYKNICEIGKERIRRAGEKILQDNKDKEGIENLDTGFRVLRVDSTNMKDVYYSPNNLEQNFLEELESNIKEDRTELDLLFSCLLAWGLPLDKKYRSERIGSYTIHLYNEKDLVACFSDRVSEDIIKHIAKIKPSRVVFRDSCFASSEDKINVEEIFNNFSPETDIRVL